MRATHPLVLTSICALFAASPSAQGTPPPALPDTPAAPAAAATTRGAWTAMRPGTRISFSLRAPHSGLSRAQRGKRYWNQSRGSNGHEESEPLGWFERYQEARGGPERSDRWSRSFKTGPSGSLDLSNISGDIVVTAGPGDEIRVEAVKKVHARDAQDATQQLEAVTIEATERAGRVEITTNYPRKHDIRVDVFYTARVPASASVSLRSVSGSIELTGVKGEARLETVSGNLTASNSSQLAKVKSVSGDVSVTEGGSADVLSLGTVSGNLSANRVKARTLEAQSISGDLTLVDAQCDRLQAKSVSGDMRFGGPLARGGRYEFNTHSGDVRLSLAGSTGFEVTANSFSGELRSEVPLSGRQGDAVPTGDDDRHPGMPRRSELRGTFGDGSALVVVQTFSGDLVVSGPGGEKGATPKDKRKQKDHDKERE